MGYDFELAGETHSVRPVYDPDITRLAIGEEVVRAELVPGLAEGEYVLEIDGREERVFVATRGDTHFVHFGGRTYAIEAINALERARREADPGGGDELIRAPMPGTVVGVAVEAGDEVDAGALLLTIESMKLETSITAPHPAHVAEVCVAVGATFDQGDALVRLEAAPDAGGREEETSR